MKRLFAVIITALAALPLVAANFDNAFTTNRFTNAFYEATTGRLTLGTPTTAGPALLTLGGSLGRTNGLYIGTGTIGNGNNLQLWQTNGESFLSFGKSVGAYSFSLYDNFTQVPLLKLRGSGIADLTGNWRPLNVGPTKLVTTDANTNLAGVAITGDSNVFFNGNGAFSAPPGSGITNSGTGTANTLAKWTGTNSLGNSTITNTASAIGLGNGSLAGTTLSGSSDVVAIGETALQTSAFTNSSSIFVVGSLADVGASNLFGFYGLGISGGGNSLFRDSSQLVWLGDSLFDSTTVTNSSDLIGVGHSVFNSAVIQTGTDLFGIGHFALSSSVITNSQDIYGFGYGPLFAAKVTNSSQIYGYGDSALDHAKVSASSEVYAYGDGALETSTLTNVSDIYAFGTSAGSALSLSGKSHIFMLGSGALATNSNDYVLGDSAYNYFFPGAGATFANYVRLSGNTNRYTDNGTNLMRNGVAVGSGAGTVTGSGTANTLTKFLSASVITNSMLYEDGTNVYQSGTGAFNLPQGTTAQRPSAPTNGMARFNTTTGRSEYYAGAAWNNHVRLAGDAMTGPLTNTASTAADVPFVAVGASGQTNDLMQWMASAGTNYSKVNSNGQFLLQRGSQTNPSIGFLEDADGAATGLFRQAADTIGFTLNGTERVRIASSGALHTTFFAATSDGAYGFTSSTSLGGGYDTQLSRDAAAVFQLGADAATPVNQALKAADGSGTDKAGANFTLEGGQGTGTGVGGTFYIATAKARTTAATVNPYTNWFSVDANGAVAVSNITGTATSLAGFTSSNTLAGVGIGTGLAMSGTNLTVTTTGVSTAVTPLAYSGTNITGFDCTTNNMSYTLTLTNHCLFGTSTFTGLPNKTTNMFFTVGFQQDATGGWTPKFTNTVVAWADGNQPVIRTNANAVSFVYLHTHLFTNSMLVGSANIGLQ